LSARLILQTVIDSDQQLVSWISDYGLLEQAPVVDAELSVVHPLLTRIGKEKKKGEKKKKKK